MKQQPDKLFHDKLASYSRPAPTRTWDSIETELDKKNRKGILWFRVAAAVVLLGSASYVLWYVYGPVRQPQGQLADTRRIEHTTPAARPVDSVRSLATTPHSAKATITTPDATSTTQSTATITPATAATNITSSANRTKKQQPSAVPIQPHTAETTIAIAETKPTNESSVPAIETPVYTNITEGNAYAATVAEAKPVTHERITLVYSAREADEYLDKKRLAQATSEEEKPSTLKKLLKKATDLKSNQDPLGELRQRKNEILALSFKSDKQRGQNK